MCVCDMMMMMVMAMMMMMIPGSLHEAGDRCGRLESKRFCWPTPNPGFSSSIGLSSLAIPLLFPHTLASSSRFSHGSAAGDKIKTWNRAKTMRDDSVNLSHADIYICGPGKPSKSTVNLFF